MGVIYKIKKEVVDYILEQKRADPNASCRTIADAASQYFQKNISKSSVNAILKSSLLSSTVGRRGKKEKAPQVFKIPEYRKEQLFQNVPQEFFKKEIPPAAIAPIVVEPPRNVIDGAGAFILKAAAWELSKEPLLASLLKKHASFPLSKETEILSDVLLFAPVFGLRSLEDLSKYQGKGLLQMHGLDHSEQASRIAEVLKSIESLKGQKSQISLGFSQTFSEVSFFRVLLENNTEVIIDARMKSFWTNNNVHSANFLPVNKALDFLSKYFMVNSQPIIIQQAPQENFSSFVYPIFCALENIASYRIKRIDLVGEQQQTITFFDKILARRRQMIVGVQANQPEIRGFIDGKLGDPQELTLPRKGEKVVYREFFLTIPVAFSGQSLNLRGVLFFNKNFPNNEMIVLTNIPESQASLEKILTLYLERWPEVQENLAFRPEAKPSSFFQAFDLEDKRAQVLGGELFAETPFAGLLISSLLSKLHVFAQKYFFPSSLSSESFEVARQNFYNLGGELTMQKDRRTLRFLLPQNYSFLKELQSASQSLNESAVSDPHGRRLFFVTP